MQGKPTTKFDSSSFERNKTQGMLFTGKVDHKQKQSSEEYFEDEDDMWIKTSLTTVQVQ